MYSRLSKMILTNNIITYLSHSSQILMHTIMAYIISQNIHLEIHHVPHYRS